VNPAPNALTDLAISLLQKLLLGVGAYFVGKGVINQDAVTWLAGGAPVIVGAAWGLWSRYQASKVAVAATKAGVNVATVKAMSMTSVKAASAPGQ
jgi:hypothetical protein